MNEKLGKQQCLEAPAHVEKQQLGLLIIYCNNTCKVTNAVLRKVMSQAQENNCPLLTQLYVRLQQGC